MAWLLIDFAWLEEPKQYLLRREWSTVEHRKHSRLAATDRELRKYQLALDQKASFTATVAMGRPMHQSS